METEKNDVITISKHAFWKYSTFALVGVITLLLVFFVIPGKSPTGNVIQQPGQVLPTEPTAKVTVDTKGDPVKGEASAKVTLVEFTDYECPFCQRAAQQSVPVLDKYVKSGDLKIITKDYPLPFHTQAQKAAEAAHCARDQGGDTKYYMMHDLLFSEGVEGGIETFKSYALQLGLDANKFNTCLSSNKFESEVKKDLDYGQTIGVQGTPAFFMNGRMISGACPAQTFESAYLAEKNGDDWAVTNCQFVKL